MINRLRSGWTMLKFVRVGLSSLILYSSIESGQVAGIVLGAGLLGLSLFMDGVCCAGGACRVPAPENPKKKDA